MGWKHGMRLAALVLGTTVALGGLLTGLAQDGQTFPFGAGGRVGGANEFTFESGPYVVTRDAGAGKTWSFAVGTDGRGYFSIFDGAWTNWERFDDAPAEFAWQPAAAEYNGVLYVVYAGTDGKYYLNGHDGEGFIGWSNVAGDVSFGDTPYLNVYGDQLWLYGVNGRGYLSYSIYDGAEWSAWAPVDEEVAAEAYESYAIDWNGYNNVFWTGTDGKVYWNRYDGEEWTGTRDLPGDVSFAYAPSATGYEPEQKLYAYGVGQAGTPYYNVFTEGEGWTGWAAFGGDLGTEAAYQPSVGLYQGAQHVVVTGNDGHAYHVAYDGAWSEWADLGDNYAYDPYTFVWADGFFLTYTGQNLAVFYKEYGA
jgi:hypothetical protein